MGSHAALAEKHVKSGLERASQGMEIIDLDRPQIK